MLLITEHLDNLEYQIEESTGAKKVFITGPFLQADIENRNKRIYEKRTLDNAVSVYKESQIDTGRAVGELNHPTTPGINLDKVSHRIIALEWSGNDVIGKAQVLDTPMGQIVKGLIEGGVKLGVSTRGMGHLVEKNGKRYVSENFILNAIDIVQDPSGPECFVNGILEGKEWVWNNGVNEQDIEIIETEIRSKNSRMNQIKAFKDFLSKL